MQKSHIKRQAMNDPLERLKQFRRVESRNNSYSACSSNSNVYHQEGVSGRKSSVSNVSLPEILPALHNSNSASNYNRTSSSRKTQRHYLPPII